MEWYRADFFINTLKNKNYWIYLQISKNLKSVMTAPLKNYWIYSRILKKLKSTLTAPQWGDPLQDPTTPWWGSQL